MEQNLGMAITSKNILKFTVPSVMTMMFLSFYVMVDGVFVSRFVSTDALSALNIVYPVISVIMAVGIMFSAGGSAICAIKLGQGATQEAKEDFTAIAVVSFVIGVLLSLGYYLFHEPLIYALGSDEALFALCREYLIYNTYFLPFFISQVVFQFFLITAGHPNRALILTLIGGITNIILDYVFIVPLEMGLAGAAVATGLGSLFASIYGFFCFWPKKAASIAFTRLHIVPRTMLAACGNGSSEMVSNIAGAITLFFFNITMMRLAGSDGVAAITIILYAQFLLGALYLGYSGGIAPLFGFNYGQKNKEKIRGLFRFSLRFILISAGLVFAFSLVFSDLIVSIFAPAGSAVHPMGVRGLRIFSISFLFSGINIFASSLFTAFSNGKISALISFLRTFAFLLTSILLLPLWLGADGVFLAVPIAEGLTILVSVVLLRVYRTRYHYG